MGSPDAVDSVGPSTLIATPVDPHVVHCRWELAEEDLEKTKKNLAVDNDEFWPALQFFDVTADRTRSSPSFSVDVHLSAGNWFVRCCSPEHMYRADLVIKNENGSFAIVASSNFVRTPPAATSEDVDLDWMPIRLPPTEPKPVTRPPVPARSVPPVFEGPAAAIETPVPYPHTQPGTPMRAAALSSGPPTDQQNKATEPSELYREIREIVQPVPAGDPIQRLAARERLTEVGLPKPHTCETKPGQFRDLTELNESSFLSGTSSTRN